MLSNVRSSPSALIIAKWLAGPSHVSEMIVAPVVCSRCSASFTKFAHSAPDIPSTMKYPTWIFHDMLTATTMMTSASLATGVESSIWPLPMSTYPWNLPLVYSICLRITISSNINEQIVARPFAVSVTTCAEIPSNAHLVKPSSPLIWLYQVQRDLGYGRAKSNVYHSTLEYNNSISHSKFKHIIAGKDTFWAANPV